MAISKIKSVTGRRRGSDYYTWWGRINDGFNREGALLPQSNKSLLVPGRSKIHPRYK